MPRLVRIGLVILAATLAGCTWLGPDIIRSGRPAYNDAILTTNDEQLLQNVVRMRYGDSLGFLTVSSVTANVSLTATGTINAGFGPTANYAGNLVPFTGTLTTEQNPTISYSPVAGDRMVRQLMSEVPLDIAALMINAAHSHSAAWIALVKRVNNLRNPDFVEFAGAGTDPRFEEVAAIASLLQRRGTLYWVRLAGAQTGIGFVLHSYSPANSREVARLLDLLGIAKPLRDGDDIVVPVRSSVGTPEPGTIAVETRSLFEVMRLAAAGIDLPADAAVGAVRFAEPGAAGKGVRILSATLRPAEARVAVEYRGRWYYIEQTDESSKQWFMMMQLLAGAQMPDSAANAPLLTIPVTGRR